MNRPVARSAAWILALVVSVALSACGRDEQMNDKNMPNMDHGTK